MEFEVCHNDPRKKQYFFISSVLILNNQEKLKMNNKSSDNKIIDFDDIFYGYPIQKKLTDKSYSFCKIFLL